MPYLKCIDESEAKYILEEVREGIYGDHTGPRSLVSKTIKTGYFYPTMQKVAREFIERRDKCQRFRNVLCIPAERLMPITFPWPFSQWGIDIIDPPPCGKRQVKFLFVAIDYLQSGLKQKYQQPSRRQWSKTSYGRTQFANLGYHGQSYRTTGGSLTGCKRLLLKIGDQEPIFVSRSPPGQWTDGSDEPDIAQDYQNSVGGSERHIVLT